MTDQPQLRHVLGSIGRHPSSYAQEIWIKSSAGLLALAEVGGQDAVEAVGALEAVAGKGNVRMGMFRGWEALIPEDAQRLLPGVISCFVCVGLGYLKGPKPNGSTVLVNVRVGYL